MERENSSPDLLEKMKACNTAEEFLALAKEEGFELSPEQLDAISGGKAEDGGVYKTCPKCGYDGATFILGKTHGLAVFKCPHCGEAFETHM